MVGDIEAALEAERLVLLGGVAESGPRTILLVGPDNARFWNGGPIV